MTPEKSSRCWPGYEPVPGKKPNSQGSCRPKAASKSSPSENEFKAKRKRQLTKWQAEHKSGKRQAAQHLRGPGGESSSQRNRGKKVAAKQTAKKASSPRRTTGKSAPKKAAPKKTAAKKTATRKKTVGKKQTGSKRASATKTTSKSSR